MIALLRRAAPFVALFATVASVDARQQQYRYEVLLEQGPAIETIQYAAMNSAGRVVVTGGAAGQGLLWMVENGQVTVLATSQQSGFLWPHVAENGDVLAAEGLVSGGPIFTLWHWDESQQLLRSIAAVNVGAIDMNESGVVAFLEHGAAVSADRDVYVWEDGLLQLRYDWDQWVNARFAPFEIAIADDGVVYSVAENLDLFPSPDYGTVVVAFPATGLPSVIAQSPGSLTQGQPSFAVDRLEVSGTALLYYLSTFSAQSDSLIRRDLTSGTTTQVPVGGAGARYAHVDGWSLDASGGVAILASETNGPGGVFNPWSASHEDVAAIGDCVTGVTSPGRLSDDAIDSTGRVVLVAGVGGPHLRVVLATPIAASGAPGSVACTWQTAACPSNACLPPSGCDCGCPNSTGRGGHLTGYGTSSLLAGDLGLQASGLPAGAPVLLFVGSGVTAQPLGNGLRCAGGTLRRLGVRFADAAGSAAWSSGVLAAAGANAGDALVFQGWYRDAHAPASCPANFNVSNGYAVTSAP